MSLLLILFGFAVFMINYERQTLEVKNINPNSPIIEYHAPGWDPLPHHVKLSTETTGPILITAKVSQETKKTLAFTLDSSEKTLNVYPGETIRITVDNPGRVVGKIKTVLWCDSWNFGSAILILLGMIVFLKEIF